MKIANATRPLVIAGFVFTGPGLVKAPKFIRPLFVAASGLVAAHAQTPLETPVAEPSANVETDFTMVQKSKSGCAFEPVKPTDSEHGLYRIIAFTKPKDYRGFPFSEGDLTISFKDRGEFLVRDGRIHASPVIPADQAQAYAIIHGEELDVLAPKAAQFVESCRRAQTELSL